MIRTQVYLTEEQDLQLTLIAKRNRKSKAQVFREAFDAGVKSMQPSETLGEALQQLIDLGEKLKIKAPPDLSINHDKYLYEDEHK